MLICGLTTAIGLTNPLLLATKLTERLQFISVSLDSETSKPQVDLDVEADVQYKSDYSCERQVEDQEEQVAMQPMW